MSIAASAGLPEKKFHVPHGNSSTIREGQEISAQRGAQTCPLYKCRPDCRFQLEGYIIWPEQ